MIYDNYITMDPYGTEGATVAWKSLDAQTPAKGPKVNHTNDPPEQVERCQTCPFPRDDAQCWDKCWYRLGLEEPPKKAQKPKKEKKPKPPKPPKEPQPPRGYDQEALDRAIAMPNNFSDEDIAKTLGIGVFRVKRWIEWRYRD